MQPDRRDLAAESVYLAALNLATLRQRFLGLPRSLALVQIYEQALNDYVNAVMEQGERH